MSQEISKSEYIMMESEILHNLVAQSYMRRYGEAIREETEQRMREESDMKLKMQISAGAEDLKRSKFYYRGLLIVLGLLCIWLFWMTTNRETYVQETAQKSYVECYTMGYERAVEDINEELSGLELYEVKESGSVVAYEDGFSVPSDLNTDRAADVFFRDFPQ